MSATEEELYGPPCAEGFKSGDVPMPSSGQEELERFADDIYRGGVLDRRQQTDELYEAFVRSATERKLWKPRS